MLLIGSSWKDILFLKKVVIRLLMIAHNIICKIRKFVGGTVNTLLSCPETPWMHYIMLKASMHNYSEFCHYTEFYST